MDEIRRTFCGKVIEILKITAKGAAECELDTEVEVTRCFVVRSYNETAFC